MNQQNNEIYYKKVGDDSKESIVLLHGFLGSSEVWNSLIPFLTKYFQVVNIDLPGHGKTTLLKDTLGMGFAASKVIDVLTTENIHSAHFVGHSMGGYVGLEVLKQQSKLVKSLTLFNSTAKDDTIQKKKDRLLAVKVFDRNPDVFIKAAVENLFHKPNLKRFPIDVRMLQNIALQTPTKGAQGCLRGMSERKNYVELIRTTKTPIQIIAGRFDNTVKYESILEQVENSNVKLVTLESGHMGYVESFSESKDALLNFLKNNNENIISN